MQSNTHIYVNEHSNSTCYKPIEANPTWVTIVFQINSMQYNIKIVATIKLWHTCRLNHLNWSLEIEWLFMPFTGNKPKICANTKQGQMASRNIPSKKLLPFSTGKIYSFRRVEQFILLTKILLETGATDMLMVFLKNL